ncbi:hypothetical protein E2C01_009300 [Portunus trituberculatus]|uniref:Uncharacterized protein n=1 Tax=Portunus trituberculatus TaxID=210409 RepID=A0A5B7D5E9_PORTR|nr:hypothetical protein [Portunus trituberculatus]
MIAKHELLLTPFFFVAGFWRSSGTLHTAFINVWAECKAEWQGVWKEVHTVLTEGLYVIIHIYSFHDLTFVHLATRSNGL